MPCRSASCATAENVARGAARRPAITRRRGGGVIIDFTTAAAPWPPFPRPTTRWSGTPTLRISAWFPGWPKRSQRAVRTLAVGPLRHDVEIPQQHAVERLGGGDQFGAVLGEDDALDQRIDRRILDADEVARAGLIGGLRAPEAALLVAGRQRLAPGRDDDVVVPLPQPVLVLRGIDRAHASPSCRAARARACRTARNARRPDRRPEIRPPNRSPVLVLTSLCCGSRSRPRGKRERLAQIVAHCLLIAAGRVGVGLGEHSAGTLSRTVSRISSSLPSGSPDDASSVPSK